MSRLDHTFPSRQGGGRWFEPNIAHYEDFVARVEELSLESVVAKRLTSTISLAGVYGMGEPQASSHERLAVTGICRRREGHVEAIFVARHQRDGSFTRAVAVELGLHRDLVDDLECCSAQGVVRSVISERSAGLYVVGAHTCAGSQMRRTAMRVTFPGESVEYRAARDLLLEQEIELRRAMEAVAAARRALPPGGVVPEDYVFQGAVTGGMPNTIRLSELFAPDKPSLVIYSFMFPRDPEDDTPGPATGETAQLPLAEGPCPSCTALLDQLDGAAEHASQHINLAVVAKAPLARVLGFARERGWRHLQLLSSADNTYNRDYLAEAAEGQQRPMLNVFHREDRTVRHFWGSELLYAPPEPGQEPRHVGTLEPLWNLFDLTPEGRPEWHEQFSY